MLRRLVAGELMAFAAVADRRSQVLAAAVQQQATHTWLGNVGVSIRACTLPVDHALGARVSALLSELGWFGIAQLQFVAPSEGEPLLIDFNGRFYGSMALAAAAGANLPAIWAAEATTPPSALDPRRDAGGRLPVARG